MGWWVYLWWVLGIGLCWDFVLVVKLDMGVYNFVVWVGAFVLLLFYCDVGFGVVDCLRVWGASVG